MKGSKKQKLKKREKDLQQELMSFVLNNKSQLAVMTELITRKQSPTGKKRSEQEETEETKDDITLDELIARIQTYSTGKLFKIVHDSLLEVHGISTDKSMKEEKSEHS